MKKITRTLFVICSYLFCHLAHAEPRNPGAYVEVNPGIDFVSLTIFDARIYGFDSFAINTNLGYLFSPYFATELGYTYYDRSVNNIDVAAKFILPFNIGNEHFSLFAKAGPSWLFVGAPTSGGSDIMLYTGLGTSWAMTPTLDLTFQAQGVTDTALTLGVLSAGLTYYFS